jgi:hypothetical protein
MLSQRFEWFSLTYDKHVAPEQGFSVRLQLIGFDGADVPLSSIRFKKGKLSYFASIP